MVPTVADATSTTPAMPSKCEWKQIEQPVTPPTTTVGWCKWNVHVNDMTDPCWPVKDSASCVQNTECSWAPPNPPMGSEDFCHPKTLEASADEFTKCVNQDAQQCASVGCVWSNGTEMVPDHDFCAPMWISKEDGYMSGCVESDTQPICESKSNGQCKWHTKASFHCVSKDRFSTSYIATADECMTKDETNCMMPTVATSTVDMPPSKCEWKQIEQPTTPPTPPTQQGKDLFTEEFCHPIKVAGTDITEAQWDLCLKKSSTDCPTAECAFNNGGDMIPDHDFCAPAKMTDDIATIQRCIKSDSATCTNDCKWRKGKTVVDNKDFIAGAKLFESNFCHPITTASWEQDA